MRRKADVLRRAVRRIYFFYGMARSQLHAETYGTYHLMGFCTLAPGGTRFQLYRPIIGMVGVDINPQGPEKSLAGVGIELEALQSEDCHRSH